MANVASARPKRPGSSRCCAKISPAKTRRFLVHCRGRRDSTIPRIMPAALGPGRGDRPPRQAREGSLDLVGLASAPSATTARTARAGSPAGQRDILHGPHQAGPGPSAARGRGRHRSSYRRPVSRRNRITRRSVSSRETWGCTRWPAPAFRDRARVDAGPRIPAGRPHRTARARVGERAPRQRSHPLRQIGDRQLVGGADIEHLAHRGGGQRQRDRRPHRILHVREAPGLAPVPVDGDRLSVEGLPDEAWHDHAVPSRLPRARSC